MGRGKFRATRAARHRKPPPPPPKPEWDGKSPRVVVDTGKGETIVFFPSKYDVKMDTDYLDVTNFGDINKQFLMGKKRFTITGET